MTRARTSQKAARLADSVFPRWTRLAVQHQAVNLGQGFPDFDCDARLQSLVDTVLDTLVDAGEVIRTPEELMTSMLEYAAPSYWRVKPLASIGIHADDYDDTQLAVAPDRVYGLLTHPSAPALPAVLAFSETKSKTGRELLTAYNVGVEVECKIAEAIFPRHYEDGFHSTGTSGVFGSVAAAVKLLGYDRAHVITALSIGASEAAGLRENFGTMTKPFHAGNAARGGVTSAMLVKRGYKAATTGLEGRFGFMHAFSGGQGENVNTPLERLGKQFYLEEPGLNIKKYPCCGSTHTPLDAFFELARDKKIHPQDVESVEVLVDFDPPRSLIHNDPHTALEGKFSIQYALAAALVDHKVGLAQFQDDAQVMRPEIRALMPKIKMRRNPGHEGKPSWGEAYNELQITLKNGKVLTQGQPRDFVGPVIGVTSEGMDMKFRDCAARTLTPSKVDESLDILHKLEDQASVRALMDAVSGR